MSGSLLDTSILIAGDAGLDLPPAAAISVITVGELHAGIRLARDEATRALRRRRLDAVRAAFSPLPVDEPVAERFGELLALARSQRQSAKATDLLIVATAATAGRTLYTLDTAQAQLARGGAVAVEAL